MSALKAERSQWQYRLPWPIGGQPPVLPRVLRRPARFLGRLATGEIALPNHVMKVAAAGLFLAAGLHGMVQGGHTYQVVQTITAHSGFAIDDVRISGNSVLSEIDLFQEVGLDGWTSLIGYDADAARERIERLAWVASASVRKVYPTTLQIEIEERVPMALWQQGSSLSVIDERGKVIAPLSGRLHSQLPLVVGMGAAARAADIIQVVSAHPELAGRVRGYVRVADRRWDLRLSNGLTIRLPEGGEAQALRRLTALEREHALLRRDVQTIDLRFDDRLVVRLTENGSTVRETALKQRFGKAYKPGRRT